MLRAAGVEVDERGMSEANVRISASNKDVCLSYPAIRHKVSSRGITVRSRPLKRQKERLPPLFADPRTQTSSPRASS